ncbi:MAG: hypothetical protein JST02_12100 [Bacteroidetes bacterium]|nr:hypothetical protein [Bacteroidota bacterium]
MQNKVRQQKLVFTGILLLLLFTYPIITIANRLSMLGGFPVLFLYIFLVWICGIVTLYFISDHSKKKSTDE